LELTEPIHVYRDLLNLPVRDLKDADARHRHCFAGRRATLILSQMRGPQRPTDCDLVSFGNLLFDGELEV
jgi:hypothetical protein